MTVCNIINAKYLSEDYVIFCSISQISVINNGQSFLSFADFGCNVDRINSYYQAILSLVISLHVVEKLELAMGCGRGTWRRRG